MKPTYLLALLLWISLTFLHAADIPLEWDDDANPPEKIRGYEIHMRAKGAASYVYALTAIEKTCTLPIEVAGDYEVYVVAVSIADPEIKSSPSNVLEFYAPGSVRLKIGKGTPVALMESEDLETWKTVAVYQIPDDKIRAFYRLEFARE